VLIRKILKRATFALADINSRVLESGWKTEKLEA